MSYSERNGSPYDRGGADSYYGRPAVPHYWPAGTNKGYMVPESDMTEAEVEAYYAGYGDNDNFRDFKDYR